MLPLKALVSTMEDTKKEGASNIRNPLNGDPRLKAMHFNLLIELDLHNFLAALIFHF